MRRFASVLTTAALLTTSCTTHPDNVEAKYVSPVIYSAWTCDQLTEERIRLTREVSRIAGLQRENANGDAAMMTVGIIILWPVLFGLAATHDRKDELGRLKGEYEAVDQAGKIKHCPAPPPPSAQPQAAPATPVAAPVR